MSSFLAIDFGERRTGLATGDTETAMVFPLKTLARRSDEQLIDEILSVIDEHQTKTLVLGIPVLADGSEGDAAERVRSFGRKLDARSELPLFTVSETLTSVEARARIGQRSRSRSKQRAAAAQIDAVAAQIIGEQFLARTGS